MGKACKQRIEIEGSVLDGKKQAVEIEGSVLEGKKQGEIEGRLLE